MTHTHRKETDLSSNNPLVPQITGKNTGYYTDKWNGHCAPYKFSGWNWAAFFLTPFWLAYRHMYVTVFIYFLVYFAGLAVAAFLPALSRSTGISPDILWLWQSVYPLAIHAFFGFKGNALYARRVSWLIRYKRGELDKPAAPLFTKTGSSLLSAFLTPFIIWLLLFIPYETADNWVYNPALPEGVYVFADNEPVPEGVLDVDASPEFKKYEARINFTYVGEEPVGDRPFEVILYYRDSADEDWEIERERSYGIFSSRRVTLDLIDAEDPAAKTGEYRVEIYVDGEMEADEEFTITPPQ